MTEVLGTIHVDGLKEMNKALKSIDKTAPTATRLALNGVADFVIGKALPGVPVKSGAARRSWRAQSTRTSSRISYGGKAAPYMPWLDFGGRTGKQKSVRRPFMKTGRYLFPVIKKNQSAIAGFAEDALLKVARDAGLDVG
jgi:hypothetical protein